MPILVNLYHYYKRVYIPMNTLIAGRDLKKTLPPKNIFIASLIKKVLPMKNMRMEKRYGKNLT